MPIVGISYLFLKPLKEVTLCPHPSVSAQAAEAPGTGWEGFLPLAPFPPWGEPPGSSMKLMARWGARSQIKHISSAFYSWTQTDDSSHASSCWVRVAARELGKPPRAWGQVLAPVWPVALRSAGAVGLADLIQVSGSTTYNVWDLLQAA